MAAAPEPNEITLRRLVAGIQTMSGCTLDRQAVGVLAQVVLNWPVCRTIEARHTVSRRYVGGRGHCIPPEVTQRAVELVVQDGLTQQKAAEAVGINRSVVSRALKAHRESLQAAA